jgi:hypothetical protein
MKIEAWLILPRIRGPQLWTFHQGLFRVWVKPALLKRYCWILGGSVILLSSLYVLFINSLAGRFNKVSEIFEVLGQPISFV